MNVAIIPAAGSGRRMGRTQAKQFLELAGVPILIHTLRQFEACPDIHQIIVVLPAADTAAFLTIANKYGLRKIARVVSGGQERQESVYRGLQAITSPKAEIVVVHDGVRPFVTSEQISATIEQARAVGAALLALPVTDTVKEVAEGQVVQTLDRSRLYLAQTPQSFRLPLLRQAHERAVQENSLATDDAALVERLGATVAIVEGSPRNIKITRPSDLPLAELLLREEP